MSGAPWSSVTTHNGFGDLSDPKVTGLPAEHRPGRRCGPRGTGSGSPQPSPQMSTVLQDTLRFCQQGIEGINENKVEPGVPHACYHFEPSRSHVPVSVSDHLFATSLDQETLSLPLLASKVLHKTQTRCDKASAPRRRGRKPKVPENLEQQMQELQESNLQLRLQLTRIEAASAKAFQELEVFQQHCDEASRQNEALLAELQRLQQQKQQRCSSSMPASSHRSDPSQDAIMQSWGFGTSQR